MLKTLLFTIALSLLLLSPGCGSSHSNVRFVNASSDAGSVDVAVDGKTVASDLLFAAVSPTSSYLSISAGTRRVEVRNTGTTTDLINSTIDFGSGRSYTLLASGQATAVPPNIAALLKTDDNSTPASGNVKLRVIHDSPGGPDVVDVYVVAPGTDITDVTPTISSLAYQQASNYLSLPAATYEVIVTDSTDGTKDRKSDQMYTLAAGQIRTLVTLDVIPASNPDMLLLELLDLN
jgi:hypothetical protein